MIFKHIILSSSLILPLCKQVRDSFDEFKLSPGILQQNF